MNSDSIRSTKHLSIYYQNTRSIKNITSDIYNSLACSNFDIIALTETWLDSSVHDGELFNNNFRVLRSDRNFTATSLTRGGGVLLAVHDKFNLSVLPLNLAEAQISHFIDILGVKVTGHYCTIYIFVIYIPPYLDSLEYEKLFDFLSTLPCVQNNDVLLLGDFNIPKYASYLADSLPDGKMLALNNFLNMLNLQQLNFVYNIDNKLLDLIICNKKCTVEKSVDVLTREDNYHPALCILLGDSYCSNTKNKFPSNANNNYNFRKANFQMLYDMLQNEDWSFVSHLSHVIPACQAFYDRLYEIFDLCVPKFNFSHKRTYPPWFNGNIIRNIKLKAKYWRMHKRYGDPVALNDFRRLRNIIKTDIDIAYANYVRNVESNIAAEPGKFWSFVNSKQKCANISTQMTYNDQHLDNPNDIINSFADFFSNSFLPPADVSESDDNPATNTPVINIGYLSETDVFNALKKLKPKLTTGPDGVPAFLVRDCARIFAQPLEILFNLCIKNCCIPDLWKQSKVCPVFKKGDKSDITNYRPISIICNFCKALEILLHDALYPSVSNLISEHQHGFMKRRSTTSNLLCITQYISEAIDQRKQTDVIYTDFSKAFDRLDHNILLNKLSDIGFSSSLLSFFHSYLSGRKNYVAYSGFRSVDFNATSGVPQGSILGPLLFNIFVNDIVNEIQVSFLIYADDLKIYTAISSLEDCTLLQHSLLNISNWCIKNKLMLNVLKCNVMSYTTKTSPIIFDYCVDNSLLQRPHTFVDLGVTFDKELTFLPHINNLVSTSFKTLGFLIRTSQDFSNANTLKILYFAFVRSKLDYASLVWNPHYRYYVDSIEKIQRRFLKLLWYKSDGVYPTVGFPQQELLVRFSMTTLDRRRELNSQVFLYKILHSQIDCHELLSKLKFRVPTLNSRRSQTFYLSIPHSNVLKFSPLFFMCENYNKNCEQFDIFFCSLNDIKQIYE